MTSTDRGDRASEVLAEAAVWTLDVSGTTIEFRTRSFWGLLKIKGSFKAVEGTARVAETGVEGTLVIDASSIDTGNKKLDQHLRSPVWFGSELHPTFLFVLQGRCPWGTRQSDWTVPLSCAGILVLSRSWRLSWKLRPTPSTSSPISRLTGATGISRLPRWEPQRSPKLA